MYAWRQKAMAPERGRGSIVTVCKKCGAQLRASAALAGKRGKCAQCGTSIAIPLKSDVPQASDVETAPEDETCEKAKPKTIHPLLLAVIAAVVGVVLALIIYMMVAGPSSLLPKELPDRGPAMPDGALQPSGPAPAPAARVDSGGSVSPQTRPGAASLPPVIRLAPPGAPKTPAAPTPKTDPAKADLTVQPGLRRTLEIWDAIHQRLVSVQVTTLPNQEDPKAPPTHAEIKIKREATVPLVLIMKKGIRTFAGSRPGDLSFELPTDMEIDLQTEPETTLVLPLVGRVGAREVDIAPGKKKTR
jgi:hypothetical protein